MVNQRSRQWRSYHYLYWLSRRLVAVVSSPRQWQRHIPMLSAIETTALTRRFGDFTAVQDVNLSVAAGQFFGFLGPNGAGKSTTIKMLTGLLAPSSGSIRILGEDLTANSADIKG